MYGNPPLHGAADGIRGYLLQKDARIRPALVHTIENPLSVDQVLFSMDEDNPRTGLQHMNICGYSHQVIYT